MKIVFIAHPIGGDVEANLADLRRIVRKINLTLPDVVPLVPYYADVVSLDDKRPNEREKGIENSAAVLKSGIIQELWLCGPNISAGMRGEKILADHLGILIQNYIGVF